MYEHRTAPLLPRPAYIARVVRSIAAGLLMILCSLLIGMIGYRAFEQMTWIDAFSNATMILSGMGPLGPLHTSAGKLFAGCYALFSGLAFIVIVGVIVAPVVHRFLHKFHLEFDQRRNNP
ncbi:MAG TPA: hypothetical protein VLY45_06715 [Nitrospiria bacterium]|nr:hypothetical protein [Nitrospiria bacterium]